MTASYFECIKYALRQSKDGYVVSFVVHPDDVPDDLSKSKIGTRYMVAFAEIGDDEKQAPVAQMEEHRNSTPRVEGSTPSGRTKLAFGEMPLSQQCAITCEDRRYYHDHLGLESAEACAGWVRNHLEIASRSELNTNKSAADRWCEMYENFQRHLVTKQYADSIR